MRIFYAVLVLGFVGGCATTLEVFDTQEGNRISGIPASYPQPTSVTTITKYKISPLVELMGIGTDDPRYKVIEAFCGIPIPSHAYEIFPGKPAIWINFDPSFVADGSLDIEFDKGLLSKVGVNSAASSGLKETANLVGQVGGAVAGIKPSTAEKDEGKTAQETKELTKSLSAQGNEAQKLAVALSKDGDSARNLFCIVDSARRKIEPVSWESAGQ